MHEADWNRKQTPWQPVERVERRGTFRGNVFTAKVVLSRERAGVEGDADVQVSGVEHVALLEGGNGRHVRLAEDEVVSIAEGLLHAGAVALADGRDPGRIALW